MIYLDTHAAIRLYDGDLASFSRAARTALERDDDVRISPAVLLEIELLFEIKRLRLPSHKIVAGLSAEAGVSLCREPFSDVAVQAAAEGWTRDPFDRLIVAQARLSRSKLVTRDQHIHAHYPHALE